MPFLITGPKHSGKSTVGRALAARTGVGFIDLDGEIERMSGKSPRALYREGPETFRRAELRALEAVLTGNAGGPDAVIAAGGGLCDNGEALAFLRERRGTAELTIVALAVSAGTAWERIAAAAARDGELPAFLDGAEDPRARHRLLHERRGAAYREIAGIVIGLDEKTTDEAVTEILARRRRKPITLRGSGTEQERP